MVSVAKKSIEAGEPLSVLSLVKGVVVERPVVNIINRGKQRLLMIRYGPGAALNCATDCEVMTPNGFVKADTISIGDYVMHTKTAMQRLRRGVRGEHKPLDINNTFEVFASQVTETEESYLMWYGKKTDVMSIEIKDGDSFITSTGFIIRSM